MLYAADDAQLRLIRLEYGHWLENGRYRLYHRFHFRD
jgi:hypothetical protein